MATTITPLPPHKSALLNACLSANALTFGAYTLKSGRQSPYFFNAGALHTGDLLLALSDAFAVTISTLFGSGTPASQPDPGFDVVFGPAYKGIPLACTVVQSLARADAGRYGGVSYCFDRKVAKAYGDGGRVVGAPMQGKRVLIIDDVVAAGTAKRQALQFIKEMGGTVVGIVVILDRQETAEAGPDGAEQRMSAVGILSKEFGIPVYAVLTLDDIIEGQRGVATKDQIKSLEEYREKYRASD